MTHRSPVTLRAPAPSDESAFLAAVHASRSLHRPWVSPPRHGADYRQWLMRLSQPTHRAYFVCARGSDELAGVIALSEIVRGNFHSAYVGYYAFKGWQGQGLMQAGLQAVLRRAFGVMKLHRLEANIQPGNEASLALVQACGFHREGFSPGYLKIGGRWRDHERWARLADSIRPA